MRPPSESAIDAAIDLLLNSIRSENKEYAYPKRRMDTDQRRPRSIHSDDGRLSRLDREAAALLLAAKSLSEKAQARTSRVIQERNAALPYHRLPVELIRAIFRFACTKCGSGGGRARPQVLSQVSHRWNDIAGGFPEIWAFIDRFRDIPVMLRKSSNAPVDVYLVEERFRPGDQEYISQKVRLELMKQLRDQSSRLRVVSYSGDGSASFASIVFQSGAPNLTDLSLEIFEEQAETLPLDLPLGRLAGLQSLSLKGLLAEPPAAYHDLRSLTLAYTYGSDAQEVNKMIGSFGNLEILHVESVLGTQSGTIAPPPSLPKLVDLQIEDSADAITCYLFQSVREPNLQSLRIKAGEFGFLDPTPAVFAPLWLNTASTKKLLFVFDPSHPPELVDIVLGDTCLDLVAFRRDDGQQLTLELSCDSGWMDYLKGGATTGEGIQSIFGGVPIKVEVDPSDYDGFDEHVLDVFPSIVDLALPSSISVARSITQHLSQPTIHETLPGMQLKTLAICAKPEKLAKLGPHIARMLRLRREWSQKRAGGSKGMGIRVTDGKNLVFDEAQGKFVQRRPQESSGGSTLPIGAQVEL